MVAPARAAGLVVVLLDGLRTLTRPKKGVDVLLNEDRRLVPPLDRARGRKGDMSFRLPRAMGSGFYVVYLYIYFITMCTIRVYPHAPRRSIHLMCIIESPPRPWLQCTVR